jgi:hypothetical protein
VLSDKSGYQAGVIKPGMNVKYPTGTDDFFNVLIDNVFKDPALHAKVKARICTIASSNEFKTRMPMLIDALESQLLGDVATDPLDRNKGSKAFKAAVSQLRAWVVGRAVKLRFDLDC